MPCQHSRFPWWFRYIGLPRRDCRLVLSWQLLSLRCSMRLSARASLVAISCCRLVPSSYYLAFRLTDTVCRVACPLLPGFSATATIVHLHPIRITGFGCGSFGFSASLSRQVFAMWPPFRVESVSVLDRDEGSSSAFLVFGWSLRDGVTLTGRVCLSSRSERRLFAHLP